MPPFFHSWRLYRSESVKVRHITGLKSPSKRFIMVFKSLVITFMPRCGVEIQVESDTGRNRIWENASWEREMWEIVFPFSVVLKNFIMWNLNLCGFPREETNRARKLLYDFFLSSSLASFHRLRTARCARVSIKGLPFPNRQTALLR